MESHTRTYFIKWGLGLSYWQITYQDVSKLTDDPSSSALLATGLHCACSLAD